MSQSEQRRGACWWALAVAVLLILYPLSYGPAIWIDRHVRLPLAVWRFYMPVTRFVLLGPGPKPVRVSMVQYAMSFGDGTMPTPFAVAILGEDPRDASGPAVTVPPP